jgi:hypothetical protein
MRKLNSSTVHEDGESATVGGGIMQHEIVAALAEHGKQAGTTSSLSLSTFLILTKSSHGPL